MSRRRPTARLRPPGTGAAPVVTARCERTARFGRWLVEYDDGDHGYAVYTDNRWLEAGAASEYASSEGESSHSADADAEGDEDEAGGAEGSHDGAAGEGAAGSRRAPADDGDVASTQDGGSETEDGEDGGDVEWMAVPGLPGVQVKVRREKPGRRAGRTNRLRYVVRLE